MEAKLAPSANLLALPDGTELVGDYRIRRVLGAGGFGITYLADETALGRRVTVKEYFPAEFAARRNRSAAPRSRSVADDYRWGLDRFIEEAQTLARFDHPNIVRVHRYFRANDTAYMVLHFEEGGSFKAWLKGLERPPQQAELDAVVAPLLDALEIIHDADFLHRDIAPDNIMVRRDGSPVLIDFGSARGAMVSQSRTVSALVKPGYSPYEQYATSGSKQGPWTDIYALGATLYHAVTGRRPPDAPSRVVSDDYVPARQAALGAYRGTFLDAIDKALRIEIGERPQRIADWRAALLAPGAEHKPERPTARRNTGRTTGRKRGARSPAAAAEQAPAPAPEPASPVPVPPDAPQPRGQLLDFIEALRKRRRPAPIAQPEPRPKPKEADAPTAKLEQEPVAAPPAPNRAGSLIGRLGRILLATRSERAPAAKAVPPPAAEPKPRKARRPWRIPPRRLASALLRVAAAVTVASLAVVYQEKGLRSAPQGAGAAPSVTAGLAPAMRLIGHRGPVVAVATTDEEGWIVSAGADATLRVWSAASGAPVRTIELSEGAVTAFAVDARRALVGHAGGTVVLWDLELGERLTTIRHGSTAITSLAFLGEGFIAAGADGTVALFETGETTTPTALLDGGEGGGPLVAAAHARGLFVSSGLDGVVSLWRTPGPRLAGSWRRLTDGITTIALTRDAGYIAGGDGEGIVRVWANPALRGARARTVQAFRAHEGRVTSIALGPAGVLASAGADGGVKVWSLSPARVVRTFAGGQVRTLSFSRDGRRLFAGGEDGVIQVWLLAPPVATGAT